MKLAVRIVIYLVVIPVVLGIVAYVTLGIGDIV